MISRRLAALALSLLAFAGCHEDPTVVAVTVTASVQALALLSSGASASSGTGTDGTGGAGGDFNILTNGPISLGSPTFVPSVPATPAPPTIFESTPVTPVPSGPPPVGSILIAGNVTTTATASALIESLNGDIVVAGTLQSGVAAGAQTNITLRALKGTVYISGAVRTSGVDSLSDGTSGGTLTISAARVVITGTIDTHGVANTTVLATNGGAGGSVTIDSSQGPVFFTGGSINTAGGLCVDSNGTGATLRGGAGGVVGFNTIVTPVNSVFIFAPITTDGGAMTGNGSDPGGGKGGDITIKGVGDIDIATNLSTLGGIATGNSINAVGGAGGVLNIDGAATARVYGSLALAGGSAFAVNATGAVTGGKGGSVLLGQNARLNSVEFGSGSYSMAGGSGQKDAGTGGGAGGKVAIESFAGDITIGASLSVAGGAAAGAGNTTGGAAGLMTIKTDAQTSGNLSNHSLSIDSLASLLDASGGAATGSGTGGAGGSVLMQCGGDLTSGARIIVSGGSSVTGTGGPTTPVIPAVNVNSAVVLQVATGQLPPTGALNVAGEIFAQGGATTSGGISGGNGASITLAVSGGKGSLSCLATLNTTGGSELLGTGGTPGNVFVSCTSGNLDLSGIVTVTGSTSPASPSGPTNGGNVSVTSGGVLTSSASINAAGGASTSALTTVPGGNGGTIKFDATSAFGGLTLLPGNFIVADGGGAINSAGGVGGSITLQTRGQAIDMFGSLTVRGGASAASLGGNGGQVIASSDFANSGTGGNITLESGSGIDASGGSGTIQGLALVNPGPPPTVPADPGATFSLPIPLAVIFDADGSFATTGTASPGRITNAGSITATGSVGGDVWYGGKNSVGAILSGADAVGVNVTGTTPGHFYFH